MKKWLERMYKAREMVSAFISLWYAIRHIRGATCTVRFGARMKRDSAGSIVEQVDKADAFYLLLSRKTMRAPSRGSVRKWRWK